jgi:type II secretion system protein I
MIRRTMKYPRMSAGVPGRFVRPGLTLLEVLLAMAIFLISLAAISTLIENGTNYAADAAGMTTASRLAQSKMAEVEAGIISISSGGSGPFEGDDANWSYEVISTPMSSPNLYDVQVRVFRTRGRMLEVKVSQILFDPAYMNNAATATPPTTTMGN